MTMFTEAVDALTGARRREADEFAALLEGGRARSGTVNADLAALAGLAQAIVPAQHTPSTAFRDDLRARLVAEAAAREPVAVPVPRSAERSHQGAPRWRTAVATLAVASVVTGAGAAAASTHSLPGDALYGLKLRIESVQLSLAGSDLERGREHLEQADHRLGEVERLAASSTAAQPETRSAVAATLTEMQDATTAGAAALNASYADTGDEEPLRLLDKFVTDQQQRLRDLMGLLDPALRARLLAAVDQADVISGRASAILQPASAAAADATRQDGWESTKLADRAGSGGGSRSESGSASGSGSTGSGSDLVGDVVAGLQDSAGAATGSAGSGSGSGSPTDAPSTGVDVQVPDGVGTATTKVPVPSVTVPSVPLPSLPPPVSSAVPTALPTIAVTVPPLPVTPGATSLPLPVPTCVAVPPLTTC